MATFLKQALIQEDRWFEALQAAPLDGRDDFTARVRRQALLSRNRALARLLHALLREGIITGPAGAQGERVVVLKQAGCELSASALEASEVLLCADLTWLTAGWWDTGQVEIVQHPVRLLEIICANDRGNEAGRDEAWRRLATEITDSFLNEALADIGRADLEGEIASRAGPDITFFRWLLSDRATSSPAMVLDQWSAIGHPLHIVPKARLPIDPATALTMFPEFQPRVSVRLAALRRDVAHVELSGATASAEEYFARHFPDWFDRWQQQLVNGGAHPADYLPFPVHPWHADAVLPERCAAQIACGQLRLLDGPSIETQPTLSVRSVAPLHDPRAPGLKLALGVRLTSVMRTITPRTCVMGPRVSRLLHRIIESDARLAGKLDLVDEELGMHYVPAGRDSADVAPYLGFLARRAVQSCVAPDELAVLAAALPLRSPLSGVPLLVEIVGAGALAAMGGYVRRLLEVLLRMYLVYGVALEAHGQNSFAVYDANGELKRILQRDFGGIRLHEPTLIERGFELDVHPDRLTVVQEFHDIRFNLLHRTYQCHIGHLAYCLARYEGLAESVLWREVAGATEAVFDALRSEVEPKRWSEERDCLFAREWLGKASLRMRLEDRGKDLPVAIRNPMSGWDRE
jgi:siderophore synthetase component